jgi:hypothetical protein
MRRIEQEQQRYPHAIAKAGDIAVLTKALQEREQQRRRLAQELAALGGGRHVNNVDVRRIERSLRAS